MTFTSTYDHRIIQGAESGLFLARIEELLLGRARLLRGRLRGRSASRTGRSTGRSDKNPALFSDSRTAEIEKQARVLELINAYRVRGHLIADIDPLKLMPVQNHPELDLETYGLTIWDLDRSFWTGGLSGREHMPLREIIALMRRVYCGKVGIEYRFISNPVEKEWIRRRVGAPPEPLPAELRKQHPREARRRGDASSGSSARGSSASGATRSRARRRRSPSSTSSSRARPRAASKRSRWA